MNATLIAWDRSLKHPKECSITLEIACGSIRGKVNLGVSAADLDRLERMDTIVRTATEQLSAKVKISSPCPQAAAKEEGEL